MLINRATMGFSQATYQDAATLGYDGWLEAQLDPASIDDSEFDARLASYDGFDTLNMSSQEILSNYAEDQNVPVLDLIEASMLRAIYSKRQLLERMVQFWTDHFNIEILKQDCVFLKTADDRDVIRQNALGTFPDLLFASARSAAMSRYLDGYANVVGHAQENYGREVMELHTMGVDGGYGQGDVEEVARALTGWGYVRREDGGYGEFQYSADHHDNGSKAVLGVNIPAGGGITDGETVLDILIDHPSTARFIAKKLCRYLLGYDPPEDIVESVKQTYTATRGDIKSMLRVILQQPVLTYLATPKIKRPFHLIASLLRATDADVLAPRYLTYVLETQGHLPFFWPTPDGYPDTSEAWGNAVLPRWQFTSETFFYDEALTADLLDILSAPGVGKGLLEADVINDVLTGGTMSAKEVGELQAFIESDPLTEETAADAFGLGASLPGFQWY